MKSQTVGGQLYEQAGRTPDDPFLWCDGVWLTYSEAVAGADRLASGLRKLGVAAGDRVAVVLPTEQGGVLALYACARLGAIQVPLNTYLRGEFLRFQLADCKASVFITDALGFAELRSRVGALPDLRHVVLVAGQEEVDTSSFPLPVWAYSELCQERVTSEFPVIAPESIFSIIYTSGTTGMPKGCLIPHRYATHIGQTLNEVGRFQSADRLLTPAPLFHTSGQIVAMCSIVYAGGAVAYQREFHASSFIALAAELEATVIFGAGAVGLMLLKQPERDTDREHMIQRGVFNGMPEAAQLAIERRFGFEVIGEMFGHTEFIPMAASNARGPRKRASGGKVLPHVEVRIVDDSDQPVPTGQVGEIVARPLRPGVMFDGYWRNPEATIGIWRNLWHHTGDYGRLDEDGFLTFAGRKKDAIRRRGEFIVAKEIEDAIVRHPHISAAAAHAVASELSEDEVRVWIVPQGTQELTAATLFQFFKEELPYFAVPRYCDLVHELPTNNMGRVMKQKLAERPIGAATWDFEALGMTVSREERRGSSPGPRQAGVPTRNP